MTKTKKLMSLREGICEVMGWEWSEAADYRYQPTRNAIPIYSTSRGSICATRAGKRPPAANRDGVRWNWTALHNETTAWLAVEHDMAFWVANERAV